MIPPADVRGIPHNPFLKPVFQIKDIKLKNHSSHWPLSVRPQLQHRLKPLLLIMVQIGTNIICTYLNHNPVANAAANTNKNGGAKFSVGSGNIDTSRIEFKGAEDLGGGLKVLFQL